MINVGKFKQIDLKLCDYHMTEALALSLPVLGHTYYFLYPMTLWQIRLFKFVLHLIFVFLCMCVGT